MNYKLEELIDISLLQDLQDKLNKVYSFPSAIIDNDGKILTAVAWQDICTKFHRKHPECEKECIKSDKYIIDHLLEANPAVSYQCPHGLIDNATPIIIDGIHLGNFFTGQFFLEKPDLIYFKQQAKKYGFDEKAYLEAVEKVPIWTKERLALYLDFIKGFIEIIAGLGLKNLKEIEINKAIIENEKRHHNILQTAMDGFWLTDIKGQLLEVNNNYCRMSGYSEDELLKMNISNIEAVESKKETVAHIKRIIDNCEDRFESKHKRKDGTFFDVEVSVKYQTENGQVACFIHDITGRKLAHKEIENNNIYLSKLNQFSIDLSNTSKEESVEKLIGKHSKNLSGAFISVFNEYNSNQKTLTTKQIDIEPGLLNKIVELFGNKILNNISVVSDDMYQEISSEIIGYHSSLYNVAFGSIPSQIASSIQSLLKIERFIGIAYIVEGELYGTSLLAFKKDQPNPPKEILENFAFYASESLRRKKAEEELKQSQLKYQFMVENTNDILWTMNPDFNLDYVSPSVVRFLGYTPEDHLKQKLDDFVTPESAALLRNEFQIGMMHFHKKEFDKLRNFAEFEIEYIRKDKVHGFAVISMVFIRDNNYQLIKINGKTTDITERKRIENKLKESELKYRSLIENTTDVVFCVDEKGEYKFTNNVFANTFGKTPDYFIGKTFWDIYPKEEADHRFVAVQEMFKTGEVQTIEVSVPLPDKTLYFLAKANPIKDETGKVILNLTTATDITERKLSEKKIKESEEKFRAVSEYSFNSICIINEAGKIIWANQAMAKMGMFPIEMIYAADTFTAFIAPESLEFVVSNFMSFVKGEEYVHHYEFYFIRGDGEKRLCEKHMTHFKDSNGKLNLVISMMDVTENRQSLLLLKQSEEDFRSIFESSSSAIAIIEPDTTISMVNDEYLKISGYTREEVIGLSWTKQIPPEDLERLKEYNRVRLINPKEAPDKYEFTFYRKDGEIRHSLMSVSMIENKNKIVASFVDITDRKIAEKLLKESEETYRSLFNSINDAVFIFELADDGKPGRFLRVNDIACSRLGYTREELLNKNPTEISSEKARLIIPNIIKNILDKKHAIFESEHVSKDGKIIPVEISTNITQYNNKTVFNSVVRDITERKRAIELIEEKEKTFRVLAQLAPVGIYLTDPSGNCQYTNEKWQEMAGLTNEEALGMGWVKGLHPEDHEMVIANWGKMVESDGQWGYEYRFLTSKGKETLVYGLAVPQKDSFGKIIRYIGINIDITERKESEKKLKEIEELFSLFMKYSPVYTFIKEVTPTESRVIQASENFKEMIGIPGQEMIGKTMHELFPAEFAEKMTADDWSLVEKGVIFKEDENMNGLNYATIKFPIKKDGKNLLAGFTIDITERVQTEQILQDVISNNPLSIQIVDDKGYTIKTNASFLKLFGAIPPPEFSIFNDLEEKGLGQFITKAINGEIVHFPDICYDVHNVVPEVQSNHIWIKAVLFPIKDKLNKITQYVFIHEDITERIIYQKKIIESEEKYRLLIENSGIGVGVFNLDGFVQYFNQKAISNIGGKAEDYIGKSVIDIFGHELGSIYLQRFKDAAESELNLEFEDFIKTNAGNFYFLSNHAKIKNSEGIVIGIQVLAHDITESKLAEAKLREKDIEFRKLSANVPDLIYQFTRRLDGTYFVPIASEGIKNIFGCSPDEVFDDFTPIAKVIHPEDAERVINDIEYSAKHLTYFTCEFRVNIPGRPTQWVYSKSTPEQLPDGCITWYGFNVNITDRKKVENEIFEFSQRLKIATSSSQLGIWDWNVKENIMIWDDRMFELYGIKQDTFPNNIDAWTNGLHPDDKERAIDECNLALKGEYEFNSVFRVLHPDGTILYLKADAIVIRDNDDKAIRMIGINKDITAQKLTELEIENAKDKLEISELRFKSLIENAPDGVAITNLEGTLTYASINAIRLFGYNESEVIGHSGVEFTHPDDMPIIFKVYENILLNPDKKITVEYRFKSKNGEYRLLQTTFVNMLSHIAIQGIIMNFTDITERKQMLKDLVNAKNKAEESDRLKSAFLANMSHEIRTPMNGILGFAELLKMPELSGQKQQEYIKIIEDSGNRMLDIINDIINISKVEAGLMEVSISEVNVNKQIDYIYNFFKPEVESKKIKFICNKLLQNNEVNIETDFQKLNSIFTNLVKNAIKFTTKGQIEIGYQKKDAFLEFYVKDTGIGISSDQKQIVFERFRQGSEQLNKKHEGSGLGLSIAKAYVEMLGGKIWVKSEPENLTEGKAGGSEFYFTLPYNIVSAEETYYEEKSVSTLNNVKKKLKVLIVEDDETSMIFNKLIVEDFSKEILTSVNGTDAVTLCKKNSDIDLVLMDLRLPLLDGYDAAKQIRQFNKNVIIIAQTAFALTGDKEKAIEAGCNDYLSKPYNKLKLNEKINKYFK